MLLDSYFQIFSYLWPSG